MWNQGAKGEPRANIRGSVLAMKHLETSILDQCMAVVEKVATFTDVQGMCTSTSKGRFHDRNMT